MSSSNPDRPKVVGIEPKHITYVPATDGSDHDALVVKELIHFEDGSTRPNIRIHEDFKRPFYIVNEGQRTYKEKRDYEYLRNLRKYTTTQKNLTRDAARILRDFSQGPNPQLRKLARSPYIYGADVSSSCLLKAQYRDRWPGLTTLNRVAGGDIETNVWSKDEEIIMMSATSKDKAVLIYLRSWLGDIENPIEKTREMADKHIGHILKKRNIDLDIRIVDTPGQIVVQIAECLHEWKPDFFTFWNMDFDVTKMLTALDREGIDPVDVFCDPAVPKKYRYFDYRQGPTIKETASGKSISINVEDRWNWMTHTATWQTIDSMPVYRILRLAAGKDSSYKLNYILDKEIQMEKLHFPETDKYGPGSLRWHEIMQRDYKIEYGVYNLFDSISLELLDEATNDLSSSITSFSKNSDYKNFNSNPKRLTDDLHFWYLKQEEPKVIGCASDQMAMDIDEHVIGHNDWIVTLAAYLVGTGAGMRCFKDFPEYAGWLFAHVCDLDIVATYPRVSILLNIARETCLMEFCRMQGIGELYRREVGVNLTAGRINATEIMQKILKAPKFDDLLDGFKAELNAQ